MCVLLGGGITKQRLAVDGILDIPDVRGPVGEHDVAPDGLRAGGGEDSAEVEEVGEGFDCRRCCEQRREEVEDEGGRFHG